MKARVMDIHGLLAGQRLDKNVLSGRIQNNAPLRILTSVTEAGSSERHMIGLQEVEPSEAVPGRGVAKSVRLPESEVQLTYLDEADLDDWLPLDGAAEREWAALISADDVAETAAEPKTKSVKGTSQNRDATDSGIEQVPKPNSGEKPAPKSEQAEPEVEDVPSADRSIDPLDFFGDG